MINGNACFDYFNKIWGIPELSAVRTTNIFVKYHSTLVRETKRGTVPKRDADTTVPAGVECITGIKIVRNDFLGFRCRRRE